MTTEDEANHPSTPPPPPPPPPPPTSTTTTPLLLAALERDLSSKRSIKECRQISRNRPCSVVRQAVQGMEYNREDLNNAYSHLLVKYLFPLREAAGTEGKGGGRERPLAWYLSRADAAVRFVEFALEFREPAPDDGGITERQQQQRPVRAAAVTPSLRGDAEINKLLVKTLRGLTNAVSACLEQQQQRNNSGNGDGDEENTGVDDAEALFTGPIPVQFSATALALLVIGLLLRLDRYARTRPVLLQPLWKGLCDLSAMGGGGGGGLPAALVRDAVHALSQHLQDGLDTILQTVAGHNNNNQENHATETAFNAKVLRFMVARLAVFLKFYSSEEENTDLLELLCRLRGLGEAVNTDTFVQIWQPVAGKVELCVTNWIGGEGGGSKWSILRLPPPAEEGTPGEMDQTALYMGQSCLLMHIMDSTAEKDVETLLGRMDELLFRSLAASVCCCTADSDRLAFLLARAIKLTRNTMWICERGQVTRARVHRYLVSWLGRSCHPVTRELVLTVLQRHVAALYLASASEPILKLLVLLLFDVRTEQSLRRNVAFLLKRLLCCEGVGKTLDKLFRQHVPQFREGSTFGGKKRKRSSKGEYAAHDLDMILQVLQELSPPISLESPDVSEHSVCVKRKMLQSAVLCAGLSTKKEQVFQESVDSFLQVRQQNLGQNFDLLALWNVIVLRHAVALCNTKGRDVAEQETERIVRLIGEKLELGRPRTKEALPVAFLAMRVLGKVGQSLSNATPLFQLETLCRCFHVQLASSSWPIQACVMTSLIRFACSVPSAHKNTLPKCMPPGDLQKLLECRLQKTIHGQTERLPLLHSQCGQSLSQFIPPAKDGALPAAKSMTLAAGSYVMSMSTREGRSAVVIFPPGDESLEDIHFMLGTDGGDEASENSANPVIQQLLRVSSTEQNSGYKLHLQPFQE